MTHFRFGGAARTAPPSASFDLTELSAPDSEELVLAAWLQDFQSDKAQLGYELDAMLSPVMFFAPANQALAQLVHDAIGRAEVPDAAELAERARKENKDYGGIERLRSLMLLPEARAVKPEQVVAAAIRIRDHASSRALIERMERTKRDLLARKLTFAQAAANLEEDLSEIKVASTDSSQGPIHIEEVMRPVILGVVDRAAGEESEDAQSGEVTSTGFENLDRIFNGGVREEDYVLLGARPSMGKTALMLALARKMAKSANQVEGRHVLIFSTEMGAKPLAQRLLAAESGNPLSRVMGGPVAMHEAEHMGAAALQFFTSNDGVSIWIDETPGLTVTDIRARAREFVAKHGKAVIFVDYLQNLSRADMASGPNAHDSKQVGKISNDLKRLTRELKCPVVALSQLNRSLESRMDKRPILSDLRESGSLEQDADIILFLYRDEVYNPDTDHKGIAELIVAKQRNGATGTRYMEFSGATQRFTPIMTHLDH